MTKLPKKLVLQIVFAFASCVIFGILCAASHTLTGMLDSQKAAERWSSDGEMPCAQVSVFLNAQAAVTQQNVSAMQETIDAALVTASLPTNSPEQKTWYCTWYSQIGTAKVYGTRRNAATVQLTAVGGDFFTMHPFPLLDGSYCKPEDLMQDRVVIDEQLAWQLFGSSAISGMELLLNDQSCLIAGVVQSEKNYAAKQAYGEMPRLYLPYTLAESLNLTEDAETVLLDGYEIVLPNPVRNFTVQTVTDAFGERDGMRILQNTGRTSLLHRWQTLRHLHELVIAPEGIAYPYWENAARIVDFDTAVLLFLEVLFLLWPVVYGLRCLWKGLRWTEHFLVRKREAAKRRYRTDIPQI